MISIFDDDGDRIPILYNIPTPITLNAPIDGNPLHIYEVNAVMVRDVFSGTTEPRTDRDGTEVYGVRKSAKLIRIDGIIRAPTFAALSDMNVALRAAFDPSLLSKLDPSGHGFAPLEFTVPSAAGNQDSYVFARPVATPDYMFDQYMGKNGIFRVELYCADPRRYLANATVHTITGGNWTTITNAGNYPSIPYISIAMSGPGSVTYSIQNNNYVPDGDITIDLSGSVNGDSYILYPNEKVLLKNGARADHLINPASNWNLYLMPGAQIMEVLLGTNAVTTIHAHHAFSL